MLKSRKTPLTSYRNRMKRKGLVRVEIHIHKEDAKLVRSVARALADPARRAESRVLLRRHFGQATARGLKALLAAAPLEGIDIERSREKGRAVDL